MSSKILILLCFLTIVTATVERQSDDVKSALEAYISEAKKNVNPRYRLTYHISPPVGWMNDPNGFSYFNGQYHMFYQFYPYDSVWGPMHWGHVVSNDLVNWQYLPTALIPEKEMCFSGSAIVKDDSLVLMYTGREITEVEPFYNETQYLASSTDGVNFLKYEGNPVISAAPNGSPEFRDPKVWKHEDHYYVILGSQTSDLRGRVLLYRSKDLITWEFLSVLAESDGEMGYMWECPDFFELDGKFILLMSPQGVDPKGDRFKNIYQTGYYVGSFSYETFDFIIDGDFQELDYGHDFYATQTLEVDGRRLVIGWFSMWEQPYVEAVDNWAGALTIIRELKLDSNNHIVMTPVEEMKLLRGDSIYDGVLSANNSMNLGSAAEIFTNGITEESFTLLFEGQEGGEKVWVHWYADTEQIAVERNDKDFRQVEWRPDSLVNLQIFLDTSSLEMFCGEGEAVFSSRVYPLGGWKLTNLSKQDLTVTAISLNRSVEP